MAFLFAFLVFVIVVATFGLAAQFAAGGKRPEIVRRRLEALEKAHKRNKESVDLKLMRDELLSGLPWFHRLLLHWSGATRLRTLIARAGLKIKPGKLILIIGVMALGAYVLVGRIYGSTLLALVAGVAAGFVPTAIISFLCQRRLRRFEKHFPEAIDLLSRAVRAGHAFSTGLEMIGAELPEPVAGEFRVTFEEQNFGLSLRDALLNLADRVPLLDVRIFVTALLIQKETGGNLAEIMDNLGSTIRERFRILGEVRVRTAQGRLTAAILIALPPFMMLVLKTMNPGYLNVLFEDPWGLWMLAVAAGLQIIGSVILWKVVHIEV